MFIISNGEYFPPEQMHFIRERLLNLSDDKLNLIYGMGLKKPTMMLIISILLGNLGIDRFILGDTGTGVGKLLTCGGLGIWTIIDWFNIQEDTRKANMKKFMMYIS